MESDAGLIAQNVGVAFGKRVILDAISLSVHSGELLAIVGPNAVGKTTLLRVLAGLRRPRSGRVEVDGTALFAMSRRAVAGKIAYCPQLESYAWPLTVEQVVRLGELPHTNWWPTTNNNHERIDRILKELDLDGIRNRTLPELSGGEQRRVSLARTLMQRTSCVLLDEPLANLDLRYQHDFMRRLVTLKATKRLAIVAVLHDLQMASLYADRIAILHQGGLKACGAPHDVIDAELIRDVFGISATIEPHERTGRPLVLPA